MQLNIGRFEDILKKRGEMGMRETLHDYCDRTNMRYLLDEWDKEKNASFTPDNVTRGSSRKMWWKCEKGHSYLTEIRLKTQGCKCPYCTNRMVIAEENSLAATNPELAAQWDLARNGDLKPTQVVGGSSKKVWWRCGQGHSWCAGIASRA